MIKIKTLEIAGLSSVLHALRLPFGKGCRSYSELKYEFDGDYLNTSSYTYINEKDLHLLSTLIKRGDEHAKAIRGLMVYAEIDAPIWFYRELETYRIGRERLSSESTMHIDCKGLSGEELEEAKDNIPMGKVQKTVDVFSYQTLRRIYHQRKNHRLPMWHDFCDWVASLPYAELFITGKHGEQSQGR